MQSGVRDESGAGADRAGEILEHAAVREPALVPGDFARER